MVGILAWTSTIPRGPQQDRRAAAVAGGPETQGAGIIGIAKWKSTHDSGQSTRPKPVAVTAIEPLSVAVNVNATVGAWSMGTISNKLTGGDHHHDHDHGRDHGS